MKSFLLLTILFFLFLPEIFCQSRNKIVLKISISDKQPKQFKRLNYQREHRDSLSASLELKKYLISFHNASYICAGIDSISFRNDSLIALINPGHSYRWSQLSKGNLSEQLLRKIDFKEKFYRDNIFSYREYARLTEAILRYSENNGYPFATVKLDSIRFLDNEKISASFNYNPGPLITFDSLYILGRTRIKRKFLSTYLRIANDQPFSQERINNLNKLIKELPYLQQARPYIITFGNNKATVQLFLEERKSNQIDGIVGFLPNQTASPNQSASKKLLVTGEANLRLKNLFGSGKSFSGEWRKFNQESQLLNLSYIHPKLLSSNLDIKIDFNLLKQDTTFLTINRSLTLYQRTGNFGIINFSGGLKTSRELIGNKWLVQEKLPPFSNFNYYTYGVGYEWNNLDDVFFPHKGWFVSTQIMGGNKVIRKSTGQPDSLYNNIDLNSVQFSLNIAVERHNRIGKRSVLFTRVEGGRLFNDQENIFFNDLYRVGGLKSLRGFAENYFYATMYTVGSLEYRFFTEETSYLLLFFDQGYIKNSLMNSGGTDFPFGFGAGVSFSTGVGIFNFTYSLGNSNTQKLNLNVSKIHFGIISRF